MILNYVLMDMNIVLLNSSTWNLWLS